jgi:hypothetical protein
MIFLRQLYIKDRNVFYKHILYEKMRKYTTNKSVSYKRLICLRKYAADRILSYGQLVSSGNL